MCAPVGLALLLIQGGDFFPAGEDLCLLGVGLRSNRAAALELMRKDLLGTRRVAVVRDESDLSQDRMHLDCVFNIASDSVCLLFEGAMGDAPTRRLIDVYERAGAGAQYALKRESVEFGEFLRGEGYTIIPITLEEQLAYGWYVLARACAPSSLRSSRACLRAVRAHTSMRFG